MAVLQTFDTLETAITDEAYLGFCLACGAKAEDVEPTARRYPCPACDLHMVFSAERLFLMEAFVGGSYQDGDENL